LFLYIISGIDIMLTLLSAKIAAIEYLAKSFTFFFCKIENVTMLIVLLNHTKKNVDTIITGISLKTEK